MNDPNRWQPLALEVSYTQNGLPLPVGPQQAVTPALGQRDLVRPATVG